MVKEEEVERDPEARNSNNTKKVSILRIREREFLRWKEKRVAAKEETRSEEMEDRVWTRAMPERSTGDKKASSDGDLLRRRDENIAEVAIDSGSVYFNPEFLKRTRKGLCSIYIRVVFIYEEQSQRRRK